MHLSQYPYIIIEDLLEYEFISEGPNGGIKKIVRFTELAGNIYNLAFGDMDESTERICDTAVTNNNDSRKVLATVANIVYDFTSKNPQALVLAQGSTKARTRLYRMGITNNRELIDVDFEVYAYINGRWEPFEQPRDYEIFLVRRKVNT